MAAPNLASLTSSTPGSATMAVPATNTELIAAPATGHFRAVDSVFITNKHATNSGKISLYKRVSGTDYAIGGVLRSVAIKTGINLLGGKQVYLLEGESMRIVADAVDVLDVHAPYLDMTDV